MIKMKREETMNEALSPADLAALQEQLLEHQKHLETEISSLRRTEDVGGEPGVDPSTDLKGEEARRQC